MYILQILPRPLIINHRNILILLLACGLAAINKEQTAGRLDGVPLCAKGVAAVLGGDKFGVPV